MTEERMARYELDAQSVRGALAGEAIGKKPWRENTVAVAELERLATFVLDADDVDERNLRLQIVRAFMPTMRALDNPAGANHVIERASEIAAFIQAPGQSE